MAQFDVHVTIGRMRERAAYVVVIQSARFDRATTRLVVPLAIGSDRAAETEVSPRFTVNGQPLFLLPLQIFAIPAAGLGPKVASLGDDASSTRIIAAIDEVMSRACG